MTNNAQLKIWLFGITVFIDLLLVFVLLVIVYISIFQYINFVYKGTSTQGEIVNFIKTPTNHQWPIVLFKDDKDVFRELIIPKNNGYLKYNKSLINIYCLRDKKTNQLMVITAPTIVDIIWNINSFLLAIVLFYLGYLLFKYTCNLYRGNKLGYKFHQICQKCKGIIYYNCYDSFANLYPHFYCNTCSNVLWREEDYKKVQKNALSTKLLITINTSLPNCPCGGRFQIDANPKCPNCHVEIIHKIDFLDRLKDANVLVIEKAKEIFIYD